MEKPLFDIIFLSIIGFLELLLGYHILTRYEKSPAIISFGFACLSIGLWVISNGTTLALNTGSTAYDLLTRPAWPFALLIFNFLYLFVLQYPYATANIGGRFLTFLFAPTALFTLFIFGSKNLVQGFSNDKWGYTIFGPDYWLYAFYIIFLFFLVLFEARVKLRKLDGIHRYILNLLFWGVLTSGAIAIVIHLILPYFFNIRTIVWIGPGASVIWLGLMGWVLVRK